ncbi:MAG TPA: VTT domain-containing protein, partial [Burkholderiales bacterium]|nr:VTT domain-containing protein [Burkholderiales bacterium]
PGDSLLFAAGTFAALKALNIYLLLGLLSAAAVIGDTVNYWVGHYLGPKIFHKEGSRVFKKEYLDRTHAFFEKYGGKTIIIARFVPIVRSFAPLVAGIGRMSYGKFISYNVIGGVGWVVLLTGAGYFFGNIPLVKKNFSLAILAIIVISTIPAITEAVRARKQNVGPPSPPPTP